MNFADWYAGYRERILLFITKETGCDPEMAEMIIKSWVMDAFDTGYDSMKEPTRITRQYLERKTKSDLAQMYLDLLEANIELEAKSNSERVAQLIAHRATHAAEHDPVNGRIHGYCIVCGVPWPCEYAGVAPGEK